MNDNEKTSAEDIRRTERERMAQVFASGVAQGKENTAKLLLTKTDLAADDILEIWRLFPLIGKALLNRPWRQLRIRTFVRRRKPIMKPRRRLLSALPL